MGRSVITIGTCLAGLTTWFNETVGMIIIGVTCISSRPRHVVWLLGHISSCVLLPWQESTHQLRTQPHITLYYVPCYAFLVSRQKPWVRTEYICDDTCLDSLWSPIRGGVEGRRVFMGKNVLTYALWITCDIDGRCEYHVHIPVFVSRWFSSLLFLNCNNATPSPPPPRARRPLQPHHYQYK
jgi:hypothetical protein